MVRVFRGKNIRILFRGSRCEYLGRNSEYEFFKKLEKKNVVWLVYLFEEVEVGYSK